LLDDIPGIVFTLGDNAYENGTPLEFASCFNVTWGRHFSRIRPSVGNHEYNTPGASGYFGYFGSRAGESGRGWYSYDAGSWHVIVLNSQCDFIGGCGPGSPEWFWLQNDLTNHPARCTLAYWHYPLFSSGFDSNAPWTQRMRPLYQLLYDAGAEVVLSGHSHDYERFAAQDPTGRADPERGIREFVVGTGGQYLTDFGAVLPNSEVRDNSAFGVLRLTLRDGGYDWRFITVPGEAFTDSGSDRCH
jgi:hypothetical protein